MGDKSRPVLLMIGGGYLIYTGSRLISEVMKSHPTSENLFIAFGAFFVIFGVLIVGVNLKKFYDLSKGEKNSDVVVEDIEFPETIEEFPVQKVGTVKKQIKMVNLEADGEKSEKVATEESQENVAQGETLEEESEENKIFDDADADDEFIEADDDEFYDDEDFDEDDEYEEYEDDDEYEDDEEEDSESESEEDLFETKLERI